MGEARSRRVFFALWPDEEASGHLAALACDLGGGGRVMRPASLHMTLAFVGSVAPSQIADLEQIAAGVGATAFDLSLDRLGFWPQRGIVWVGCCQAPAALLRLGEELASALGGAGFAVDHRSGSAMLPHITLARRVRCKSLPRLGTPIAWRVSEFSLVESQLHPSGASYETLASFPLAASSLG